MRTPTGTCWQHSRQRACVSLHINAGLLAAVLARLEWCCLEWYLPYIFYVLPLIPSHVPLSPHASVHYVIVTPWCLAILCNLTCVDELRKRVQSHQVRITRHFHCQGAV